MTVLFPDVLRASCRLAGGLLLFASAALAQGKMPYELTDEVIYNGRSFDVWFGLYETETVRSAPDTGLPQKEWIEQSRLVVRTNQDPQIGPGDKALAQAIREVMGKAPEYVDISRLADEAMDKIGQIPKGRRNGFNLVPRALRVAMLSATATRAQYFCHFGAASVQFAGSVPKLSP